MANFKNESSIPKLGIILFMFAGLISLMLSAVHVITKEPIEKQAEKTRMEAMQKVLPNAKEFKKSKADISGGVLEIEEGYDQSKLTGYALKVAPKGYAGNIQMMVGISTEGKVLGIKILAHSETPGLGAKATEPKFSDQYKDKKTDKPLEVTKNPPSKENEIQAITASTITSKAVTEGVNEAMKLYNDKLKGGQK